ncbi:MAG: hypothetical protein Q4G66_07435 [bacterium]|nr:hypothetical protein [bacterium]
METQGTAREQMKLELAVKMAQLEEVRMRARVAAAEAEAQFSGEIGKIELEVNELRRQLRAAGGASAGAGDQAWTDLREGVLKSTRALGNLLRNALDRM